SHGIGVSHDCEAVFRDENEEQPENSAQDRDDAHALDASQRVEKTGEPARLGPLENRQEPIGHRSGVARFGFYDFWFELPVRGWALSSVGIGWGLRQELIN